MNFYVGQEVIRTVANSIFKENTVYTVAVVTACSKCGEGYLAITEAPCERAGIAPICGCGNEINDYGAPYFGGYSKFFAPLSSFTNSEISTATKLLTEPKKEYA